MFRIFGALLWGFCAGLEVLGVRFVRVKWITVHARHCESAMSRLFDCRFLSSTLLPFVV